MKKLLGISLVAILAATPLMANAAGGTVVAGDPSDVSGTPAATTANPMFSLAEANTETDGNAASAGYVKGAYNAAIKAVNKVATQTATSAGAGINKTDGKISVDYTTTAGSQGLKMDGSGDTATLNVNTDNTTVEIGTSGVQIKDGGVSTAKLAADAVTNAKLADDAVQTENIVNLNVTTAKLADGAVTVGKIASDDMVQGTGDYAARTDLTSQGYVDQQVAGINTALEDYATQKGVEDTIKGTSIAVTDNRVIGLTGDIKTSDSNIKVMTTWGSDDDSHMTTHTYLTEATTEGGTLATTSTGSITAAITPATVEYKENQ